MKKFTICMLLVSALFLSCEKQPENEAFIGQFSGMTNIKYIFADKLVEEKNEITTFTITAGADDNLIIIDGKTEAQVNGSVFLISDGQTVYSDISEGLSLKTQIEGGGNLTTDGGMVITMTAKGTYESSPTEIKISGVLSKLK